MPTPARKNAQMAGLPHKKGENVFAKWPHSNLWYPATIKDNHGHYLVEFEDGTTEKIHSDFVSSSSKFRSASKSPSRSSSASTRKRSRSRSRGRSRSPSRTKSKESPSPARTPSRGRSATRSSTKKDVDTKKLVDTPITPTRHSARIQAMIEQKVYDENNKGKSDTSSSKKSYPAEPSRDFGGPIGACFMILVMPMTVFGILLACNKKECNLAALPLIPQDIKSYFDVQATGLFIGWVVFQAILANMPFGRVIDGQPLRTGRRLKYRCNGFLAFFLTCFALSVLVYKDYPVTIVYDKFIQFASAACAFAFLLSIYLYIRARHIPASARSAAGSSGNFIYDFFMGRELNPRIRSFDLKFFFEMRPGLIGWVVINGVFVTQECITRGKPDTALLAVAGMQALYVLDALWFESSILTTMDITHDGFGFMLAYGDLVWVPFLYSLQGRYLVDRPQNLSPYTLAGFVFLFLIGYWIFRGSNSQKNEFRKNPYNPALAHLESMPTSTGRRLLLSGWWGLCRHPNYLGDLIMALAWSLPCGFNSVVPYFYPIFLFVLLVHRACRDDQMCQRKYGASWDRYKQRVQYRIFPYIY